MVDPMKYVGVFVLCLLAGTAAAEMATLADPTRPAGASFGPGAVEGEGGLRLQSVFSPRGGKPTAIINGQVVPLGARVGDARLVRLGEAEAVLKGPKGIERLFLTPDVSKKNQVLGAAAMDNEIRKKP